MAKFRISGGAPISLTVGGESIKPDKNSVWEMSLDQAKHLAQVYRLEQLNDKGSVVAVLGEQNATSAQPQKAELSKESLISMERADLIKKCEALKIKVEDDDSKGDIAEKIMAFVTQLGQVASKGKK